MRTFTNYGNYNSIVLRLTRNDIFRLPLHGECEPAVLEILERPYIKKQVAKFDAIELKKELSEYGAWDDSELSNHEQNIIRWIWISALNIREEKMTKVIW